MLTAITALYRCFYDKELWSDVALRWRGAAIGFMVLLCLLATAISTASGFAMWQGVGRQATSLILDQLPSQFTMTLDPDGNLSSSLPQPTEIKVPDGDIRSSTPLDSKGETVILMDVGETLQSIQEKLRERKAMIYVVRDGIYARQTNNATDRVIRFNEMLKQDKVKSADQSEGLQPTTYTLTRDQIDAFINVVIFWILAAILPLFLFLGGAIKLPILALLFMLVGVVMIRMMRMELGNQALWRLAVVALAPATILEAVVQSVAAFTLDPAQAAQFGSFPIFALVTGLYLYGMLRQLRQAPGQG
ncbi:MAG: DUF1189 family protein [Alphaproteobacteria bacterium]|nr:MAG: DUF1189 family protein [Alphaproteobacteria bacterium]